MFKEIMSLFAIYIILLLATILGNPWIWLFGLVSFLRLGVVTFKLERRWFPHPEAKIDTAGKDENQKGVKGHSLTLFEYSTHVWYVSLNLLGHQHDILSRSSNIACSHM
jgi:hypothetical protein